MGIRYRKSINLGKGFRVNMSKTGPGFSWGGKGYRITKTANGNIRGTAYIPGTGISYQKDFGNPHKKIKAPSKKQSTSKTTGKDTIRFDNDLSKLNPGAMADVIKANSQNRNNKIIAIILILAGLGLAILNPLFLLISIAGIALLFYNKENEKIAIDYDMTDEAKEELDTTNSLLAGIMESDAVWLVKEIEEFDEDNEANMRIIDRSPINFYEGTDGSIETNATSYTLESSSMKLIFLPDSLFIKEGSKMTALSFSEINMDLSKEVFLEDEKAPKDATILGKTYEHTNKDGSPDKRYKENRQLNLVEYGVLSLEKSPGLEILIVFSDTVLDGK
ncbi:DUF4236 domain-containing protein [uncultured Anaerococcus sp.]|uniref:DUF4236 domain-containing protein n=1 Tax=uncultured Anaerococcus sp. TaxID=293428 RepID=UPI00260687E0|nr:DUF4236 domain-containing protein [uncultured Anaerococcus sp.]